MNAMKRGTISISLELKKKLDAMRGNRTWEDFLSELAEVATETKIRRLETFLHSTAHMRDVPPGDEKLRLRLERHNEGHSG